MKRTSTLTLVFAFLSAVFFLALVLLRVPFPGYPLMSWQDALDILTPLVLLPIYWKLFTLVQPAVKQSWEKYGFIILSGSWAMGHGMHLSANSANNLAEKLAENNVLDILDSDLYKLIYFYDEYLSHYLWHIGVLGLAALVMYRAARSANSESVNWPVVAAAGVIYGLTLFMIILEGETLPMGLPILALISVVTLLRSRKALRNQPILAFFFIACLLASLIFVGWGLVWGGFPTPSALGWI